MAEKIIESYNSKVVSLRWKVQKAYDSLKVVYF